MSNAIHDIEHGPNRLMRVSGLAGDTSEGQDPKANPEPVLRTVGDTVRINTVDEVEGWGVPADIEVSLSETGVVVHAYSPTNVHGVNCPVRIERPDAIAKELAELTEFVWTIADNVTKLIDPPRTCRACGCTDEEGCPEGCWWVEADLCSSCADRDEPELDLSLSQPALAAILAERYRQFAKFGNQHHSLAEWVSILTEEVGEAAQAVNAATWDPPEPRDHEAHEAHRVALLTAVRTELVQTAAVAVQIIEHVDEHIADPLRNRLPGWPR